MLPVIQVTGLNNWYDDGDYLVLNPMVKGEPSCPCGSDRAFSECCGCLLSGERTALTAEQLMRSRYSAFVLKDEDYLRKTWHPDTCPDTIGLDDGTRWLGLKIMSTRSGGTGDDEGTVEFVARYKIAGRGFRLHEVSRFVRRDGQWVYLDGTHS